MLRALATSRLLRWGFVACAAALGIVALVQNWSAVQTAALDLSPLTVLGAFVSVAVGIGFTFLAWRALLTDLGSPLPLGAAARIFFLAQLGKYVPGSIWPFLAQVELGREHGVPRRRSATASVVVIAITIVAALLISSVSLPFVSAEAARRYWWLVGVGVVFAACLHPAILNPLVGYALRLARRPPLEHPLSWSGILRATGWALASWVAFGCHIWLLVESLGATGATFLTSLGAFPLAWTVGFLVVIAPAGVGPREIALAAGLAPILGSAQVVLVLVVSRLLMTLGDLAYAGLGYLLGRRHRAAPDELAEAEALRRGAPAAE